MRDKIASSIVVICAICGIVVLELYALHKGINGKIFSFICLLIAGLGGYHFNKLKDAVKTLLK